MSCDFSEEASYWNFFQKDNCEGNIDNLTIFLEEEPLNFDVNF